MTGNLDLKAGKGVVVSIHKVQFLGCVMVQVHSDATFFIYFFCHRYVVEDVFSLPQKNIVSTEKLQPEQVNLNEIGSYDISEYLSHKENIQQNNTGVEGHIYHNNGETLTIENDGFDIQSEIIYEISNQQVISFIKEIIMFNFFCVGFLLQWYFVFHDKFFFCQKLL